MMQISLKIPFHASPTVVLLWYVLQTHKLCLITRMCILRYIPHSIKTVLGVNNCLHWNVGACS